MAELIIWMEGRHVGVLDGADRRRLRIVYDDDWRSDPRATPLSVSMPPGAREHVGRHVANYLWGLLPDNDRVINRWARDHQCAATDVFGLLVGVGADVAGAAQYLSPGDDPDDTRPGLVDPLDDDAIAELLRGLRSDATAWHTPTQGRWSLAGAQPKLALAWRRGRWGIPSGTSATTHILKPAIAGLDHHDLNEHLCLRAARISGLRVAETEIRRFAGEPALVVTRYDRIEQHDRVVRVHQEDGCQALGVHPSMKYQADGGPGVEDVARLLREVSIRDADDDVRLLVRAAAFNWLLLGTDAHAKNVSLLLSGRQVRLAPLYDIASAAPYDIHPRKLRLAQKVGGEYRPTIIGRRHWERLARSVDLDVASVVDDVAALARTLPDALADSVRSLPRDRATRAAARTMVDAMTEWVAVCAARMS